MRLVQLVESVFARQQGYLFPWAAVFYAVGIGTYFALRFEPARDAWAWLLIVLLACAYLVFRSGEGVRPVWIALMLTLAGFAVAGAKAHWVAEETLDFRF